MTTLSAQVPATTKHAITVIIRGFLSNPPKPRMARHRVNLLEVFVFCPGVQNRISFSLIMSTYSLVSNFESPVV